VREEFNKKSELERKKILFDCLFSLKKTLSNKKVKVMIFSYWWTQAWQIDTINEFCENSDWAYLDLNWIGEGYGNELLFIDPKDNHPSPFANKILAKEIYKKLIEEKLIPLTNST